MKALLQRVTKGSVVVDGKEIGSCGQGFVVFLGIHRDDTHKEADILIRKIPKLRVFEDSEGKMNRSLLDRGGSILLISQFTLLANVEKGNRPSFIEAALPEEARALYDYVIVGLQEQGIRVETGEFGGMMQVEIHNDGPTTIMLET